MIGWQGDYLEEPRCYLGAKKMDREHEISRKLRRIQNSMPLRKELKVLVTREASAARAEKISIAKEKEDLVLRLVDWRGLSWKIKSRCWNVYELQFNCSRPRDCAAPMNTYRALAATSVFEMSCGALSIGSLLLCVDILAAIFACPIAVDWWPVFASLKVVDPFPLVYTSLTLDTFLHVIAPSQLGFSDMLLLLLP